MDIKVSCYAGYRGEETPRTFTFGNRNILIEKILDRWLAPDHRYFKVVSEKDEYILRHDPTADKWELVYFKAEGCSHKIITVNK